jgi:hypothetical protein
MYCTNCGKEFEGNFCPECGTKVNNDTSDEKQKTITINDTAAVYPDDSVFETPEKQKKPIYKRVWFWIIIVVLLALLVSCMGGESSDEPQQSSSNTNSNVVQSETNDNGDTGSAAEKEISNAGEEQNSSEKSVKQTNSSYNTASSYKASSTSSKNDGYATAEKFNKIQTGMSYEEVVEIMGSKGELLSSADLGLGDEYVSEMYSWKAKIGLANCNVTFQGGKVISKAQL